MKTFEVAITKKWIESELNYVLANSHKEVAEKLEKKNKRVFNDRYSKIERTGGYYRITEMGKGGKSFIFEVL